jgi:hypothetical protein
MVDDSLTERQWLETRNIRTPLGRVVRMVSGTAWETPRVVKRKV